ncbi:hypothetical protein ACW73L_08070 [Methylolobus aquaticus]
MRTASKIVLIGTALLGAQPPALAESNPNDNQIYVPVSQCRVVDTRQSAGGNLVANVAQDFYAYGDAVQISGQGGNPAGCADPKAPNGPEPAAVAVNITAVGNQASGNGNIRASAVGVTPANALVNFTQGTNLSNAAIVPICRGSCSGGKQLSLMSALANVPAVVDVIGYFYPKGTHVVTVATDGGDFTSPIDAIAYLKALVSGSDPDAPSATNPWVVQIDPGTYALGASALVLDVPYVTVKGAGSDATVLTGEGANATGAVQVKVDTTRLESVSVRIAAGITDGTGIVIDNSADASSEIPVISEVAVSADDDGQQGLIMEEGSSVSLVGGSVLGEDFGIEANHTGVAVFVDGTEVIGNNRGAYIGLGASLTARNAQFIALEGILGEAVVNGPLSAVRISHSTLRGEGLAASALALASLLEIQQSTIDGPVTDLAGIVLIGASQVTGTVSGLPLLTRCVASYNGNFQPLNSACTVAP